MFFLIFLSCYSFYILPPCYQDFGSETFFYFFLLNRFINGLFHCTKKKFSIKDLFGKCEGISRKLRIWSHLLKKALMENFIFLCSVRRYSRMVLGGERVACLFFLYKVRFLLLFRLWTPMSNPLSIVESNIDWLVAVKPYLIKICKLGKTLQIFVNTINS